MTTVVTARRVIDGTGRAPIEDGAVLVDGDRITAVGRRAEIPIPDGAQLIDCGDQTLLPGFVDAHSHASLVRDWATRTTSRWKRPTGSCCARHPACAPT